VTMDPQVQTLTRHPQILKDATLFFSRATPNLAIVIPAMDEIERRFTDMAADTTYHPAIRYALRLAKATLNKYYSLTDSSETYRIAMGEVLFFYGRFFSLTISIQYYIHVTNSSTSRRKIGRPLGFQLHGNSFKTNTREHTLQRINPSTILTTSQLRAQPR
jgi:hypothetical protein